MAISLPGFTFLREKTYSCEDLFTGKAHQDQYFQKFKFQPPWRSTGIKNTVKEYLHKNTGMEFILISGGTFDMGTMAWENTQPVHTVKLKPFLMSKYPVTQSVWKKITGDPPSSVKGDHYPIEYVSWEDCKLFCEKAGLSLPTESQWEYACKAGANTSYYWGKKIDGDYTWYSGNSEKKTHPVGLKKPNAFGLYDMIGNVWEWCEDDWNTDYEGVPCDGSPNRTKDLEKKICRGASCESTNLLHFFCSSYRNYFTSNSTDYDLGFRVVSPRQK